MPQQILLSGIPNRASLLDTLRSHLRLARPNVVGVASAFVSVAGVQKTESLLKDIKARRCRLIAGVNNAVTHPNALYLALQHNWEVRIAPSKNVFFHPKLLVGGQSFRRGGEINGASFVYVGSSNLTNGGFKNNIECGLIAQTETYISDAGRAFASLWQLALPATNKLLKSYSAYFADRNRRRSSQEIEELGISDQPIPHPTSLRELVRRPPRVYESVDHTFACAAWAGLQSFTGEYMFQIEFPRAAGEVVKSLIGKRKQASSSVDVFCPADGTTRTMTYRYYTDNSMFRLNVQNDLPGVAWARRHHDGLALIEQGTAGGAPIRLNIYQPGLVVNEIITRSLALGTWGHTATRLYGWY